MERRGKGGDEEGASGEKIKSKDLTIRKMSQFVTLLQLYVTMGVVCTNWVLSTQKAECPLPQNLYNALN